MSVSPEDDIKESVNGGGYKDDDDARSFDLDQTDAAVKPSLSIRMIRHAESFNNEVYRNARYLFRGGCPDFDAKGWSRYVDAHRKADPSLSQIGKSQAQHLANFLVPHLSNQASHPIRVITSPMRRTLETIRPTLQGLHDQSKSKSSSSSNDHESSSIIGTQVIVHGYYFESEGCHLKEKAEEGMSPQEITELLLLQQQQKQDDGTNLYENKNNKNKNDTSSTTNIEFVGFPDPNRGWYVHGKTSETRQEAEERASRFYLWLMELLDQELLHPSPDGVFDAGVAVPGEENENEHDRFAPRQRRRQTTLLVGHGDFMSLVLTRIVAGFCHAVEQPGRPHRAAFVHYNTGITELEYFGGGRFLIMGHNQTPHFSHEEYRTLRTGGSLKDGWSYIVPTQNLNAEVSVAFADELPGHVRQQTEALKSLYLSSRESEYLLQHADSALSIESDSDDVSSDIGENKERVKHFIVKRGMQVVGVATYCDKTGLVKDVAVRPSAGTQVSETLFSAVKNYSRKLGRSGSLHVFPRSQESQELFKQIGFHEGSNESNGKDGR